MAPYQDIPSMKLGLILRGMALYKRKMESLGYYPRIYDYYGYNDQLYDDYDYLDETDYLYGRRLEPMKRLHQVYLNPRKTKKTKKTKRAKKTRKTKQRGSISNLYERNTKDRKELGRPNELIQVVAANEVENAATMQYASAATAITPHSYSRYTVGNVASTTSTPIWTYTSPVLSLHETSTIATPQKLPSIQLTSTTTRGSNNDELKLSTESNVYTVINAQASELAAAEDEVTLATEFVTPTTTAHYRTTTSTPTSVAQNNTETWIVIPTNTVYSGTMDSATLEGPMNRTIAEKDIDEFREANSYNVVSTTEASSTTVSNISAGSITNFPDSNELRSINFKDDDDSNDSIATNHSHIPETTSQHAIRLYSIGIGSNENFDEVTSKPAHNFDRDFKEFSTLPTTSEWKLASEDDMRYEIGSTALVTNETLSSSWLGNDRQRDSGADNLTDEASRPTTKSLIIPHTVINLTSSEKSQIAFNLNARVEEVERASYGLSSDISEQTITQTTLPTSSTNEESSTFTISPVTVATELHWVFGSDDVIQTTQIAMPADVFNIDDSFIYNVAANEHQDLNTAQIHKHPIYHDDNNGLRSSNIFTTGTV